MTDTELYLGFDDGSVGHPLLFPDTACPFVVVCAWNVSVHLKFLDWGNVTSSTNTANFCTILYYIRLIKKKKNKNQVFHLHHQEIHWHKHWLGWWSIRASKQMSPSPGSPDFGFPLFIYVSFSNARLTNISLIYKTLVWLVVYQN